MLQSIRGFWLLSMAAIVLSAHADTPTTERLLAAFPQTVLTISTPDARRHQFRVWVATNDALRAQGLMFVRDLTADAGMLFVYPRERTISMWMKNTFIPLDMVFIRGDGRVSEVVANTTPQSLQTIASKAEVPAILELNAGTAARLGIRAGAIVDRAILEAAARNAQ